MDTSDHVCLDLQNWHYCFFIDDVIMYLTSYQPKFIFIIRVSSFSLSELVHFHYQSVHFHYQSKFIFIISVSSFSLSESVHFHYQSKFIFIIRVSSFSLSESVHWYWQYHWVRSKEESMLLTIPLGQIKGRKYVTDNKHSHQHGNGPHPNKFIKIKV